MHRRQQLQEKKSWMVRSFPRTVEVGQEYKFVENFLSIICASPSSLYIQTDSFDKMQFLLPLALALLSASKAQTDSGIWNSCYSPLYEQSGTSYTGITDNPNWWLSAYCYEDDGSVNENAVIELGGCLSNNFGQLIVSLKLCETLLKIYLTLKYLVQ
jgi:hypothetical protein